MDRVAVDGVGVDLFMVVEHAVSPKRAGTDDVSICEDVSARSVSIINMRLGPGSARAQWGVRQQDLPFLRVHDKSGSLAGIGELGVERTRLAETDGDDSGDDLFDGLLPLRRVRGEVEHGRHEGGTSHVHIRFRVVL
jgi:hypothetical protein